MDDPNRVAWPSIALSGRGDVAKERNAEEGKCLFNSLFFHSQWVVGQNWCWKFVMGSCDCGGDGRKM